MAPQCGILNIKVMDSQGEGTEESVVSGIDDVISLINTNPILAPSVLNLSFGGTDDGDPDNPVRVACRVAINAGIWVIAGAGNSGPQPGTIDTPACEQYVMAVGSAKYLPASNTFAISDFSSRGPTKEGLVKPDAVLFGEDTEMASSQSDTATTTKSGTSFSAPFASGMALLYLEAIARQAVGIQQLTNLPVSQPYQSNPEVVLDKYLPLVCLKPAGEPAQKDDDDGYGMPFGPLMDQVLQAATSPATMASMIEEFMVPIVGLAMVGIVLKQTVPA
jgi:serine protease AprX